MMDLNLKKKDIKKSKDPNKITKYILSSDSRQTNEIIYAVHITIHLGNNTVTGLSFEPKI